MIKKLLQKPEDVAQAFLEELYKHDYDESILNELLSTKKININLVNGSGNSFLHLCIINNKFKSALWLIEQGADVELLNQHRVSPLQLIIDKGHKKLIEIICKLENVDLDKQDQYGRTILQNAVVLGHSEIAKVLIENGVDINIKDYNGRNVIFDALSFGDKKFIQYLLSFEHLELNNVDKNQNSIMHHPQALQDDDNALNLIRAGADATLKDKEGQTFLCSSALRGMEAKDIVDAALEAGNDINSKVKNNNSILMELVAASANISEKESERRKSLLDISKEFVKKGIDINAVDDNHETALFRAVRDNDFELVSFLLSTGINPNIRSNNYETSLSIAAYKGVQYIDIILVLLRHQATPNIKNGKDQTLYEVLNNIILYNHNKKSLDEELLKKIDPQEQYMVIVKELLNANTEDLNYLDSKGQPLFFEPILYDHFPLYRMYIKAGLRINNTNTKGHNIFFEYVYKVFKDNNVEIDFQNNLSALLSSKLNQNFQDNTGYTVVHKVLHTECNIGLFDTLTQVVLFDYKLTDKLGRSVMHSAVWNNKQGVMKKLHGINKEIVNIPDSYGILPITYAALLGSQELVLLFIELNANIKSGLKITQSAKKLGPSDQI
jgi:ankyrin repeat protein